MRLQTDREIQIRQPIKQYGQIPFDLLLVVIMGLKIALDYHAATHIRPHIIMRHPAWTSMATPYRRNVGRPERYDMTKVFLTALRDIMQAFITTRLGLKRDGPAQLYDLK